jgi:hypothetical protein
MAQVPVAPVPLLAGTPKLVLAVAASDAPVPPSATAKSVIPVTRSACNRNVVSCLSCDSS